LKTLWPGAYSAYVLICTPEGRYIEIQTDLPEDTITNLTAQITDHINKTSVVYTDDSVF
jgi:hypothetical protein